MKEYTSPEKLAECEQTEKVMVALNRVNLVPFWS
jgi:hypothetical protein